MNRKEIPDDYANFLAAHDLINKARTLRSWPRYPITTQHEKEYNQIDQIRVKGMKEAEKKCRKLRMGAIPYTPTYSRIRTRIEIWSLVVKKLLGGKARPVFLRRKARRLYC